MPRQDLELAMRRRLVALLRKGGVKDDDADAARLLELLLQKMSTKRHYEEVLGSPESAEKFAKLHRLPFAQEQLLLAMQHQKDIFTPNPLLDALLTAVFLAQVALVLWAMWARDMAVLFLLLCVLIDGIVSRVKHLSATAGNWLSNKVMALGAVDAPPLAGPIQMKKWQEQSWQLFVHTGFAIAEAIILARETWWDDPATCWLPHPWEQRGKFKLDLQVLYLAQLGVWMYTCFIHRFVDERRKDYFVMYIHHVVTIALVGVSWAEGYMRIGLLVLFVHDVSDIFVDLLKMVNYLKLEAARGWFATEIAYVACVLSWLYWRLYEYPFRVLQGSLVEPSRMLGKHPRASFSILGVELFPPDLPLYTEMNVLLFALLGLHVYWFHLFCMVGYRILTESAREASRQEYEGDSDDEEGGDTEGKAGASTPPIAASAGGGAPAGSPSLTAASEPAKLPAVPAGAAGGAL